jgi:hypothetical protein
MKCSLCEVAVGFVKTIPADRGKARTPAIVAALVLLAHGAIQAMLKPRPGCRMASGPNSTKRVGVISSRGWKRKFEDSIPLPRGRKLVTLEDAARYIQKLPKAEQQLEEWQTAVEVMILVAESNGGPTMMARIGVMRALNRHHVREFNPDRKNHHWGKRELARDR